MPPKAGSTKAASPAKTNEVAVIPAGPVGEVIKVVKSAQFVVVSYIPGRVPAAGKRLNVYRNNLKVAELKVTGPRNDGNTVADIIEGEVQVDDEVRQD